MKLKIAKLSAVVALALVTACTSTKNTTQHQNSSTSESHNAQNSLSYDGIYRGLLPCADCEGIKTTIYLMRNNTYKVISDYQGKKDGYFETNGTFSWDKTGSIITLIDQNFKLKYKVGEGTLTQLDQDGKAVSGALAKNYILTKDNYAILNKKWRLMELMGKKITSQDTMGKDAYLMLDDQENRYTTTVGCNTISGTFTLESFNRLALHDGISTMMACENNDIEIQLKEALKTADSFQINADELILIKGRMAPLAKFKIPMH